jgi:hypothetical protein
MLIWQLSLLMLGTGWHSVHPIKPVDGPIKYVLNTIQGMLRLNMGLIVYEETLLQQLHIAIGAISSFEPYFINCGFWRH